MTARILVVDDVPANLRLLEARLLAEYFEVVTAASGAEALEICESRAIDVVLLDVLMPGMDGFEVCARLKAEHTTAHIPVVMITSLDQASDRVRGLQAGADDFLSKPVNDLQLITRVKSLVRLKMLTDELRVRAATTRSIGIDALLSRRVTDPEARARILMISEGVVSPSMLAAAGEIAQVHVEHDPQSGLFEAAEGAYDCVVISTDFATYDPLRLCSQIRSLERTRFLPIMMLADAEEDERIARALELGVNDFVVRPVDEHEFKARLITQVKRSRYNEGLRSSVIETIEMAVTDGLTGLHNRRYLDSRLQTLLERAQGRRRPLSVLVADIDRFKAINDAHGHDAGDAVLREFARRLRMNVRGIDLACRFGGEEFVVVMPDTDGEIASKVAERVRSEIARAPFAIPAGEIAVTVSLGVAALQRPADTAEALLKRADTALYEAKSAGRNRVVAKAA